MITHTGTTTFNKGSLTDNNGSKGGAIRNNATLNINSSNLISNSSTNDGGAIFNKGTLNIKLTIFSNNVISQDGGAIMNKSGVLTLIESTLHDNEGPTLTHSLQGGSPALNAGGSCQAEDQRNLLRDATCDIGAFENGATCPDLTGIAALPIITESICTENNGIHSGGAITANVIDNCPTGSALMYSLDNVNFSGAVPSYIQDTPVTIYTKCICNTTPANTSASCSIATSPGLCPPAPIPTLSEWGIIILFIILMIIGVRAVSISKGFIKE